MGYPSSLFPFPFPFPFTVSFEVSPIPLRLRSGVRVLLGAAEFLDHGSCDDPSIGFRVGVEGGGVKVLYEKLRGRIRGGGGVCVRVCD